MSVSFYRLSAALLLAFFSLKASSQTHNQENPYYGAEFYSRLHSGTNGQDLKNLLVQILRSAHLEKAGEGDVLLPSCPGQGACRAHTAIGYNRARVFLLGNYYLVNNGRSYAVRDVYCEKEYGSGEFKNKKPGPSQIPDDAVVNVEHTWPQSKFTRNFPEDMQKSDLHHLFPTDSKMNSARSSYPFGEVVKDKMDLKCKTGRLGYNGETGGLNFEPPDAHKGNVARALFYFAVKYGMQIDSTQEKFLRKWHKEDPVDADEMARNEEIQKLQGSRNPFIDHPEIVDLISDF